MPTPFDVLGALSFAQGVLTLIASIVAAVFAATQQVNNGFLHLTAIPSVEKIDRAEWFGMQSRDTFRNNDRLAIELMGDISSTMTRAQPYLATLDNRSQTTKATINEWQKSSLAPTFSPLVTEHTTHMQAGDRNFRSSRSLREGQSASTLVATRGMGQTIG
jgi:hypothetical protein